MNPPAPPTRPQSSEDDCRCLCGSLLARVIDGHVELKCRRCKRTLRVPIAAAADGPVAVDALPERRAL